MIKYGAMDGDVGNAELSRALVEAVPVAVFTLAVEDGALSSLNPEFEHLTGCGKEALGRPMTALVEPGDVPVLISNLHQVMLGSLPEPFELRLKSADGSFVTAEVTLRPQRYRRRLVRIMGFARDVTERRTVVRDLRAAKEAAEAGSLAKSEFLANMSHEIRTPLNAVVAMTGLLLDMELPPQAHGYAEIIRSSGKSLLDLINSVLDFSKIESHKLEIENQPFAVGECVTSAVEMVSAMASAKGLAIETILGEHCPAAIFGDVTRVRQVLVNLLSNAVKFTEEGSVTILVDTVADPAEPQEGRPPRAEREVELTFEVRDTGIGIPLDKQTRIFDVFDQADASTTRRFGGTGLGLTISRRLTELMGGTISVESAPGEGSTFRFSIHGRTSVLSQPAPEKERSDPELSRKMPLRILVAEDHPINQIVARLLLEQMGYQPDVVADGREAVEALEKNPYDVVLMDVHMPVLDGLEATREIRRRGNAERPKIIALTASTLKGDREQCLAAGMDEFLGKPIDELELEAVLKLVGGFDHPASGSANG